MGSRIGRPRRIAALPDRTDLDRALLYGEPQGSNSAPQTCCLWSALWSRRVLVHELDRVAALWGSAKTECHDARVADQRRVGSHVLHRINHLGPGAQEFGIGAIRKRKNLDSADG